MATAHQISDVHSGGGLGRIGRQQLERPLAKLKLYLYLATMRQKAASSWLKPWQFESNEKWSLNA